MVATVSDHEKAHKAIVKAGGVLVSADVDREFTSHSSFEVRRQAEVRMECSATARGFSSRAVAPCGMKDSSAVVDEESFNTLTPATAIIHQRCGVDRRAVFSTALSVTRGLSLPVSRVFQACACGEDIIFPVLRVCQACTRGECTMLAVSRVFEHLVLCGQVREERTDL